MIFDLDHHATAIERDGFTVIDDFLSPSVLAEVRRVFGLYLGSHSGRNSFEGFQTERVYTLVARAKVMWDIVLDPRVLALCERFLMPNYLLTASQAITIAPGEAPQAFHHDDSFYHLPRPRPMISLSTIVAVDDFTPVNGATDIIPGSHTWGEEALEGNNPFVAGATPSVEQRLAPLARPATMPAGACIVFSGTLVHRGGCNVGSAARRAFSNQYCQPWARQQENFILATPPEVARAMPHRLKELLGYSVHPPFIGQLTASHPLKSLDPGYENALVAQARAAGARLPE
ncbi:MAG: phytanoyl-CoA dioxygenase family protein [Burkholderiales bacterium]